MEILLKILILLHLCQCMFSRALRPTDFCLQLETCDLNKCNKTKCDGKYSYECINGKNFLFFCFKFKYISMFYKIKRTMYFRKIPLPQSQTLAELFYSVTSREKLHRGIYDEH